MSDQSLARRSELIDAYTAAYRAHEQNQRTKGTPDNKLDEALKKAGNELKAYIDGSYTSKFGSSGFDDRPATDTEYEALTGRIKDRVRGELSDKDIHPRATVDGDLPRSQLGPHNFDTPDPPSHRPQRFDF